MEIDFTGIAKEPYLFRDAGTRCREVGYDCVDNVALWGGLDSLIWEKGKKDYAMIEVHRKSSDITLNRWDM